MKKYLHLSLILALLFLVGCSSNKKYPYEHIGIYDTKTQQYIDIGDSKNKVDKILGPCIKDENDYYDYDDILSIRFDDNNNVEHIRIFFDWFPDEGENERYTLADGTSYNSTITEFVDKYDRVYEGAFILPDTSVSVILQNKNNKIVLPSIDDIKSDTQVISTQENENIDDVYIISIDYVAYDNLSSFDIEKVSYPSLADWGKFSEMKK